MRRGTKVFISIYFIVICLIVNAFSTLIALLFEDGVVDAIPAIDIMSHDEGHNGHDERQVIPRVIHQTYINDSIPAQWVPNQRSCIDLHPDYEYKLWTDSLSREFIRKEYAWFLKTFDSYPFPIQRADAIRYFVLDHYGGIYLDLDDGCARRLEIMLGYPAWLRRTLPTGISNDAMASVPHHPFFKRVIESLENYAKNYGMHPDVERNSREEEEFQRQMAIEESSYIEFKGLSYDRITAMMNHCLVIQIQTYSLKFN